ncbi:MAG: phenylalanine--tRNA ligase subunit alpha [Rickettsiaceae bacterium]|nr:phenylalanine--tRNA ligase subunit alpha [Rickettsiaceae bacterium]
MKMIENIVKSASEKISSASNLKDVEDLRVEFLGKSSALSLEMRKMGSLSDEDKKTFGKMVNDAKIAITSLIDEKYHILKKAHLTQQFEKERVDLTLPARYSKKGSIHPISQCMQELLEIFVRMGFSMQDGPSIEDDWHNFTALNIPEHHPARQMHDTFYMNDGRLLRTHTSPVQIRGMMNAKPPFRFIAPGRTYRCDSDMTHTPMFHQIEILMIDKGVHMGHLKYLIEEFVKQFFEKDTIETRLRPSFFPFTEPSAEVDIKIPGTDRWLEVLGCGMVHPNVLRNVNIDPEEYQGFALGMGVERFAMIKYGIQDLRQFFDGDQRWIDSYSFSAFDIPSFMGGLTR